MNSTHPRSRAAPSRRALLGEGLGVAAAAVQAVVLAGCGTRSSGAAGADNLTGGASLERFTPVVRLRGSGASDGGAGAGPIQELASNALEWVLRTWPEAMGPRQIELALPTTDSAATSAAGRALSGQVAATTTAQGLVVLSPHARGMLTDEGVQVVLAHEFTHVMLGQFTDTTSSRWAIEGSAQWTATRFTGRALSDLAPSVTAAVRRGQFPVGPPADAAFDDGAKLSAAYDSALVWSCFLVARFGPSRFRRFVTAAPANSTAFHSRFGSTTSALRSAYRTYLAHELAAA